MPQDDKTSIGVVGAGVSGIAMGIHLKRAGFENFTIYEKADEVGGTWRENTYPGLHCDVPSHLYCYSFELNPDWSQTFAGQPEIKAYLQRCTDKHGLARHLQLGTSIERACYDEDDGSWTLSTGGDRTVEHRVVVSATGGLTAPNLPKIEGYDVFKGRWWHSGAWNHGHDLSGKRVAVVGSAASAVQVVPHVAGLARQVFVLQRTPNYVLPRRNLAYRPDQKEEFKRPDTRALGDHRRWLYRRSLRSYQVFKKIPAAQVWLRTATLDHLRAHISDPALIENLTPRYTPGCKRLLVSDEYYPALAKDHVQLIDSGLLRLSETGILATDGSAFDVDVVIFCTGYKLGGRADGRPALDVIGRGGHRLRDVLNGRPQALYGVAIPGFPNYFTVCGINGVVAYASVTSSAEVHAEYIARRIRDLTQRRLRSIEVKSDVVQRFSEEAQAELQSMSWAEDCPNFYRDSSGRILSFYPGTLGRLRREMRARTLADYKLEAAGR
jgi:cation diffusion facilitator CzcD-associated flavoprotein CzcO